MLTAKKVKIVLLVSLFFFIAMPIMIGSHATPVSAKPIELKFAFWMPTKHSLYRVWAKYAKEVEQLTNGQVKITIYAGGALGGPLEQWDMAVGGVADISFFMPGYTAGRFPRSTVFDLPLIAGGTCTVNTAIAQGVYDKYIAPDYKDAKMLVYFVSEPFTIHTSKKKISSMADMKGLKFRSSGKVQSDMVKRLGGSPVSMPITEVYTSLEKGVIDGVVTAFTAMVSFRLYDVSKYSIQAGLTATPMAVAMNLKRWNSLPPEIKKIFDDLRMRYAFEAAAAYDEDYDKAIQRGKSLGKEIYPLSAGELKKWENQLAPMYNDWVADMKSKGIPGGEMVNAIRQVQGK
jgi:TRAP-type C4-dicarboxylate transport system substrate-binding protein